jgi:hypothetical protein
LSPGEDVKASEIEKHWRRAKEFLLKGKDQYSLPPRPHKFRSAAFYTDQYFFFFFYKTTDPNEEVNCTEPSSLQLGFREKTLQQSVVFLDKNEGEGRSPFGGKNQFLVSLSFFAEKI